MNVRTVGSYEIVFCDHNDRRLNEITIDLSLHEAMQMAIEYTKENPIVKSYFINKVVHNSKYNVHTVK